MPRASAAASMHACALMSRNYTKATGWIRERATTILPPVGVAVGLFWLLGDNPDATGLAGSILAAAGLILMQLDIPAAIDRICRAGVQAR